MIRFGTPEIAIHRGTALRHENNDIYVVIALTYDFSTGIRYDLESVTLERKRDKVIFERKVSVVREQIEKGLLTRDERNADKREKVVITKIGCKVKMETID